MKEIVIPEWSISNKRGVLKHGMTPLVSLSVDSLTFGGNDKHIEKLNSFYEDVSNAFTEFAKTTFFDHAKADYESDDSPRKKYRYTPFELIFNINCQSERENELRVNIKITVAKRKKVLAEKNISHMWTLGRKHAVMKKASPLKSILKASSASARKLSIFYY